MTLANRFRTVFGEGLGVWRRALALGRYVLNFSGHRALLATIYLLLGSFAESISLLLLLPMMQFMSLQNGSTLLSLPMGLLTGFAGPALHVELWLALAAFVVLVCASALFARFKNIYLTDLLLGTINHLRMDLFGSIAGARWSAVAKLRVADLDHVLTGDIDRVHTATMSLFLFVQNVVFLIAYIILSSFMSLKMTLFAILAGGLTFLALRSIRQQSMAYGDILTVERQAQYRTINSFLTGLKVTKSFNGEHKYLAELRATLGRMHEQGVTYTRISSLGGIMFQSLSVIVASVFIYLSYAIYHVPFTRIIILLVVFMRIAPRFKDMQDDFQLILINLPAFETMQRIKAECDANRENQSLPQGDTLRLTRAFTFENVTFSYGDAQVLHGVSFQVPAGGIVALIGESGSGKSTLADLAMGLLSPSGGQLAIDGLALDEDRRRAWRGQVAYVPQDTTLLSASIADNLAIAAPQASREAMRTALAQAHALNFVERLPNGLDTLVGDGGQSLSGGERQRVALARALLRKPSLLILDEATSALDNDNTQRIIDSLESLRGETTVLLITHNPLVLRCADTVIAMESGRVATETVREA